VGVGRIFYGQAYGRTYVKSAVVMFTTILQMWLKRTVGSNPTC